MNSLIWIYTIGMMAFMGMNGVLALYLKTHFGVTEETIGYFFIYVGGVSAWSCGRCFWGRRCAASVRWG